MDYAKNLNPDDTPQTEPLFGREQVQNNAGGYTFAVDLWTRLTRFLILGAEGGSYYVGERPLVIENAKAVLECIKADGVRAVQEIVTISKAGRAPKNDPAIFALALAAANGNAETKKAAYSAIKDVCRTGTHLFQFCDAVQKLRGWSRGLRNGVAAFYLNRNVDQLALQFVKYRQRNGWTHRDVLRLSHPSVSKNRGLGSGKGDLFNYVVKRDGGKEFDLSGFNSPLILAYEKAKTADFYQLPDLITQAGLPWEAIPTEALKDPFVWKALLPKMGLTAMIRNLGRMSSVGLFQDGTLDTATQDVIAALTDPVKIKESRVHPIQILIGLKTYASGRGFRGSLTWNVNRQVVDALNKAFYLAFSNVEPTGKRFFLGVDVSGSMGCANINGTNLTAREAAAAMALAIAKTEPFYAIAGFSSADRGYGVRDSTQLTPLPITPDMSLEQVIDITSDLPFGATDCSLPIEEAIKNKIVVDVFIIITDNETYDGKRHASVALQDYRKKVNPNAKMVVLGTCSNNFTIADPNDAGMLDVAGFDASVPEILADFVR